MFTDDVISLWVAASLGAYGTTIFQSSKAVIPAGDGPYLQIIEYGGGEPQNLHQSRTTPAYQFPTAQCFARGKSHTDTKAKAWAAYSALAQNPATGKPWRNVTLNGIYYVSITPRQQPFDMGDDGTGRIKFGFNLSAQKRPY